MTPFEAAVSGPPTRFDLDGETYEIRGWGLDAIVPVAAFDHESWPLPLFTAILTPGSFQRLSERLADPYDGLDLADLRPVAETLVEAAYGRPYWTAGRLMATIVHEFSALNGLLTLEGVDLLALLRTDLVRAADTITILLLRSAEDEAKRARIEHELTTPPPRLMMRRPDLGSEVEGDMFFAALAQHGRR